MPYRTPACHLPSPRVSDSRRISPPPGDTECPPPSQDTHTTGPDFEHAYDYSEPRFAPVRGACQEVSHTKSRRSGPRKWRGAVVWLIAAGLHPRANATTQRVADDLAQRMDYDTGHVRYCVLDMVDRLDISEATVYRHVAYLRELGALAWVVHGSHANSNSAQDLEGYAATATVYAAVIPPVYDHAMGHQIVGTGYTARIIVDLRKRAPRPVDNSASEALETPSLTLVKEESQVQMVGGFTTTAKRSRNDSTPDHTPNSSSRKRGTILGAPVTAAGMRLGDKLARVIRRRVPWVRNASHDQLRWVCADMGEQQWTEDQAVRFVVEAGHAHKAGYGWDPARPHRLIAAALLADAQRQKDAAEMREALAQAVAWQDSTAGRAAADRASLAALFAPTTPEAEPERTDEDRKWARMDWDVWPDVIAHLEEDELDAVDLYGKRLVDFAIDKQARLNRQEYARA